MISDERKAVLQKFFEKYKNKCLALRNWLQRMNKDFSLIDALDCIYDAAEGKVTVMDDMITRLTDKKKLFGRGHVQGNERMTSNNIDIRRNADGRLELFGYSEDVPLTLKGQHAAVNPNIVRKDGQVSKVYRNMLERMVDIGAWVRKRYPSAHPVYIARLVDSIRRYTAEHKVSAGYVCGLIDKGKLMFDSDDNIVQSKNESVTHKRRNVIISEKMVKLLEETNKMTEYRFTSNMRFFIRNLLVDPINAQVPPDFSQRGYTKSRLIQILINNGLLEKHNTLSDTDENGQPKPVTMLVKYGTPNDETQPKSPGYRAPESGFARKLKKLYIKMFERNVPAPMKKKTEENLMEDGEGGVVMGGATTADSSGSFVTALSGIQRRKMPTQEATTTAILDKNTFDAPVLGDDETLARHNGVGGSVSVNHAK